MGPPHQEGCTAVPAGPMLSGLSCALEAHGVGSKLERSPSRLALSP